MRNVQVSPHKGIVCVIPARGGSKGIPKKNLTELNGKPLIAWSISAALASASVSRVIVSTDSENIADTARRWGAEVPFMRPPHLAFDSIHASGVVLHALDWLERNEECTPEGVMMLLPTSPMCLPEDIRGAVNLFKETMAPAVISVVDLGKYMTNLRYLTNNSLERVAPQEDPNAQRQGLRKLYSVNGAIFLARPQVLRKAKTFHVNDALGFVMKALNSVDINAEEDLAVAKELCGALQPWKSM